MCSSAAGKARQQRSLLGLSPRAWVGLGVVWALAAVYRSAPLFAPPPAPAPPVADRTAYVQALERYVVESNRTIAQLHAKLREKTFGTAPRPRPPAAAAPKAAAAPAPKAPAAVPKASAASSAPGRAPWAPVALEAGDWVVYLRVQKTGSQTLWMTLVDAWDGSLWSPSSKCVRGPFCGHKCEDVLTKAFRDHKKARKCQLFVRAHANWYDYERALAGLPNPERNRIRWLAFFRDPVKRALSEHDHVTRGLVAQFGPHTFGKAWDYDFTDSSKSSLDDWLACDACARGSRNRQARFLAGLATTGEFAEQEASAAGDAALLAAALANLDRCAYVGVLDRFQDAMLLLKMTFPHALRRFTSYKNEHHPKLAGDKPAHSAAALAKLRQLNELDVALYERAKVVFDADFEAMVAQLPPAHANRRFRQKGRTFVLS